MRTPPSLDDGRAQRNGCGTVDTGFAAAAGPFTLGYLTKDVFGGYAEPMRYAGVTMSLVFLVGLAALPFAPETKGKPLPE